MVTQSVLTKPRLPDYSDIEPLPDPHKRPDMEQFDGIKDFAAALEPRFTPEEGYLVKGGGYLRSDPDDRGEFVPDIIFAKDVEDPERIVRRNGYVISEVGKPPDLVLEVGSRSTGRRDYTIKRKGYARYGVREYWRFDPSGGEYHDAPLGGDTLVDGEYVPMEILSDSDGNHWGYSEVLELEIWWYDGRLRFRDPVTGEFLPNPRESYEATLAAERRAQSAERRAQYADRRAQSAERRAQLERQAREAAESRMAEMEAELQRLRGQ